MSSLKDGASCHGQPERSAGHEEIDLGRIRERLQALRGRHYWRGLEELAATERFREFLHREFPRQASEWTDAVSRRDFLQLMGASLALAGLSACTRNPVEKIVPYVKAPEYLVPGQALYYATTLNHAGSAMGVLVETQTGRPIKIEGNDLHPASLGRTDAITQASILSLYDPDRSQVMMNVGEVRPWGSFISAMREAMAAQKGTGGSGFRILTETVTSPALADQIESLLAQYPNARWYAWEPFNRDNEREGTRLAFGRFLDPRYRIDQADVIVSLDADFLSGGPAGVRCTNDFASRRRAGRGGPGWGTVTRIPDVPQALSSGSAAERPAAPGPNRLYVIESTFSLTGARADHRLPMSSSQVEAFARALHGAVGGGAGAGAGVPAEVPIIARDLLAHRGRSLVMAGAGTSPAVHALAHAMNAALGNVGSTVVYTEPVEAEAAIHRESLARLTDEMNRGQVSLLLITGGNPVYTAPESFATALDKVALRVHLGLYQNETSDLCHWHIPETHYLEAWGDGRAFDGTASIQQPVIAPLYEGKSVHEFLAAFSDQPDKTGYDRVRDYWRKAHGSGTPSQRGSGNEGGSSGSGLAGAVAPVVPGFEEFWRRALHDGVIAGTALPVADVGAPGPIPPGAAAAAGGLEVVVRPDPHLHDGRHAGNAWLQELPRPISRITWDNAVWIAPSLAQKERLANGDVVEVVAAGTKVTGPVWIVPGLPADSLTVHAGYGRTRAGRVGTGVGFNVMPLLAAGGGATAVESLRKTGKRVPLATVQEHGTMEGRHLVRSASLEENEKNPQWVHEMAEDPPDSLTMYRPYRYDGYKWGMTIDLSACVGCDACTIACQAENNIPVVGKKQVLKGREMHWIRVDRYYEGDLDAPAVYHQPVPCMHCENAPCEVVCPVEATVHDSEGLNEMVYNRCVGTRYCSNNCPYKVRRFNFLQYSDQKTPSLKFLANPDVTVRTRGVMEKCTYCIQRISEARITAEKEDRRIRDGEVTPACAQACPAQAIIFGDLNDTESRVARLKQNPLNYGMLTDLNTRPRTTYLADLRHPNPEMPSTRQAERSTAEAG